MLNSTMFIVMYFFTVHPFIYVFFFFCLHLWWYGFCTPTLGLIAKIVCSVWHWMAFFSPLWMFRNLGYCWSHYTLIPFIPNKIHMHHFLCITRFFPTKTHKIRSTQEVIKSYSYSLLYNTVSNLPTTTAFRENKNKIPRNKRRYAKGEGSEQRD